MKTKLATAAVLMIATVAMAAPINAQDNYVLPQVDTQTRVAPTVQPGFQPQPQPANRYYFGMNVQLIQGYGGTTLRVVSVTPGSPAFNAGLECGDEIRTVNGQGFTYARDSFEAVNMMNQYVDNAMATGPAPAAAAATAGAPAQAYVAPWPQPQPQPRAQMIVRNVRNGQNVFVTVYPQQQGWGGGIAASAAPAAAAQPALPVAPAPVAPTAANGVPTYYRN